MENCEHYLIIFPHIYLCCSLCDKAAACDSITLLKSKVDELGDGNHTLENADSTYPDVTSGDQEQRNSTVSSLVTKYNNTCVYLKGATNTFWYNWNEHKPITG